MATRERKSKLILYADEAVRIVLAKDGFVEKSYDGQISAFSVATAISGLKTAMAIYMKSDSGSAVDRKKIIAVLARIYDSDHGSGNTSAERLWDIVKNAQPEEEKLIKKEILEYAIALKLTFRTFKYKDDGR